ncbi:MAG: YdcF family protein [Eubacterium sp.]|nr:YdcF family protein [Eubacterium sp.]
MKKKGVILAIIRILMALVGGFYFGLFMSPTAGGILNIGNITGAIVSVIFILYAILFHMVNGFIKKLWKKRSGKRILVFAAAFVGIILATVIGTSSCMVTAALRESDETEVLIVLGCKVNGEEPCSMLEERLVAAKAFLEENQDVICIVSGGQGSDEDISEAECMKRWLVASGIDEDRIIMEDQSTSTYENINYSANIIESEGLGMNVAIASNEFHIYRAGTLAEHLGLTYSAVPAQTSWWLAPTYVVREMYGIVAENMRSYIFQGA